MVDYSEDLILRHRDVRFEKYTHPDEEKQIAIAYIWMFTHIPAHQYYHPFPSNIQFLSDHVLILQKTIYRLHPAHIILWAVLK
jgi:hypothetical protein